MILNEFKKLKLYVEKYCFVALFCVKSNTEIIELISNLFSSGAQRVDVQHVINRFEKKKGNI